MRANLVVTSIFVVLLSTACSKPETAVSQTETSPPSAVAVEPMPDAAAATALESATGTVTQTSVSTMSEQVIPPTVTAASAAPTVKPVTSTPTPATKTPPATASATATTRPTATTVIEAPPPPAAKPPSASTPPAAPAVKPATQASSGKAPKTHTVDREGIKHAPGDDNATQKCGTCHGKDLKGGKVAKTSCFECHDQNWK